jgi:hypothetical protein
MTTVTIDTNVATSAEKLWETLRQSQSALPWSSLMPGAVKGSDNEKNLTIPVPGGGAITQRLEHVSDTERLYVYSMTSSALPVKDCVAKCRVVDNGNGTSTVEWSSNFTPDGVGDDEASRLVRSFFETGFRNFQKMFPG